MAWLPPALALALFSFWPAVASSNEGVVTLGGVDGLISIVEGSGDFEYTVSLQSKPSATVWVATQVTPTSEESTAPSKLHVDPSIVVFEPQEWNSSQVVGPTNAHALVHNTPITETSDPRARCSQCWN